MPSDPIFIKFDGTPVAGRVPVRMHVDGAPITPDQQLEVSHLYQQFRTAVGLSVAEQHGERHTLADGSEVIFESMQDKDEIYLLTKGGNEEGKLPHGFAVTTNWQGPLIYKRRLEWDDGENQWAVAEDFVPQVEHENYTYDNQVFKAYPESDPVEYFNLPMVYRRSQSILWDYGIRGGLNASSIKAMPFWITDGTTEVNFQSPHYAMDNTVVDDAGTVLYTMPLADQILLPEAPEPDEPQFLGSSTDAQGNQLAMNHWRFAVISPTFNIWKWRFANERLNRATETTYTPIERVVQDVTTPVGAQTVAVTSISDAQMGEEIDDRLVAWNEGFITGGVGGAGYLADLGISASWATGWVEVPRDLSGVARRNSFDLTTRIIKEQDNGEATLAKLLAVGGESEAGYIPLKLELNYPATVFWRGGEKATGYFTSDVFGDSFPPDKWGVSRVHIKRYDTNYDVDGTPTVTAELGWLDLKLIEGTTTGRMSGREHHDIREPFGDFGNQITRNFITREVYQTTDPGAPNYIRGPTIYDPGNLGGWLAAHNIRNTEWEALRLQYGTGLWGPNPSSIDELTHNERPANTVGYSLTSRYVIDYDHKGQFYAAIRCEVTCSGAEWEEDLSVYKGFMKLKTDPTYTVKIWFECRWGGLAGPLPDGLENELLLVEETITRRMFEVIPVENFSPWYWPFPAYLDRSCIARTPPQPVPDENFMMQLKTLASHQGYNDNLACADVRTDLSPAAVESVEGIEYSYLKDGRVVPHERYVTGQLYARTFKLSDFYEAFWMLYQLKVNVIQDNFQPPEPAPVREAWFYHPLIKAALAVTRHIEVRDGGIVNWSDDIDGEMTGYPPAPAPRPAYTDREIRIHRV